MWSRYCNCVGCGNQQRAPKVNTEQHGCRAQWRACHEGCCMNRPCAQKPVLRTGLGIEHAIASAAHQRGNGLEHFTLELALMSLRQPVSSAFQEFARRARRERNCAALNSACCLVTLTIRPAQAHSPSCRRETPFRQWHAHTLWTLPEPLHPKQPVQAPRWGAATLQATQHFPDCHACVPVSIGNACSKAACSLRHLVNLLLRHTHPASQP